MLEIQNKRFNSKQRYIKIIKVFRRIKKVKKFNLIRQLNKFEKENENNHNLLFKEEIEEKKENDFFYYHKEEEVKNDENLISKKISKKCNFLSKSIQQNLNKINKNCEKMKKLNSFCLQKISKEYFRLTPSKNLTKKSIIKMINDDTDNDISKINMNRNYTQSSIFYYNKNDNLRTISATINSSNPSFINKDKKRKIIKRNSSTSINRYKGDSKIYEDKNIKFMNIYKSLMKNKTTEKLKNYVSIDINDLYKYNNKSVINLERFNDSFRIQMNNTCYKFIPHNHLKRLNELQRDNALVRKSMEKIKGRIAAKIKDITNKRYFLKKYNKIKEDIKNEKNKIIISARKLSTYPDKLPPNIKFQNLGKFCPYGFKTRLLYEEQVHSLETEKHKEKMMKIDKKNEPEKNMKINDYLLEKALKKLSNSLNSKNISKYINEMKNENTKQMTDSKEKKYFQSLKEANYYIQKFDLNKINKKYKIKEKNKNYMEIDENDNELEGDIIDIEEKLKKLQS